MSGTSLDGLDLCLAEFEGEKTISWRILKAATVDYPPMLISKLKNAHLATDEEIRDLDKELGNFFAIQCVDFCDQDRPDLIASHGHTIKHRPDLGYTLQIGDPVPINEALGAPVVFDFRSQDVELGGQGAPLVPIGDLLLFPEYDFCVNLGGFANYSTDDHGVRVAADICPVNIVLNQLARKLGMAYDHNGKVASEGPLDQTLLDKLNSLDYYKIALPKSLGREWVDEHIDPLLANSGLESSSLLRTFTEHSAIQISQVVSGGKALFTGGGTKNAFLMQRIEEHTNAEITIPDEMLIDFKEALIFALLGLLRAKGVNNTLSSVSGATRDHCAGQIVGDIRL